MKIISITQTHLNDVLSLFTECFKKDKYYITKYKDYESFKQAIYNVFKDSIRFCLDQNMSIGLIDNDKLIGFLLLLNYTKTYLTYKDEVTKLLTDDFNVNTIESHTKDFDTDTMYILSIGVSPNYRNKGLSNIMMDYVLNEYQDYHFISDISNKYSLSLFRQKNFKTYPITNNYWVAVK